MIWSLEISNAVRSPIPVSMQPRIASTLLYIKEGILSKYVWETHPFRLQLSQQAPLFYLQVQKTTSLPFVSTIRPLQEIHLHVHGRVPYGRCSQKYFALAGGGAGKKGEWAGCSLKTVLGCWTSNQVKSWIQHWAWHCCSCLCRWASLATAAVRNSLQVWDLLRLILNPLPAVVD